MQTGSHVDIFRIHKYINLSLIAEMISMAMIFLKTSFEWLNNTLKSDRQESVRNAINADKGRDGLPMHDTTVDTTDH